MKNFKKLFIATLVAALVLPYVLLLSACSKAETQAKPSDPSGGFEKAVVGSYVESGRDEFPDMRKIADTGGMTLYFNFTTTDFAVFHKATNEVYYSNPLTANKSSEINEKSAEAYTSSLGIEYIAKNGNVKELMGKKDSVDRGQFQVYKLPDQQGLRIVYTLGVDNSKELVPLVFTVETYEALMEKLTESQKEDFNIVYKLIDSTTLDAATREKFLKDYPSIGKIDMYVARNMTARQKTFVKTALTEAEFSLDDMLEEMEKAGYAGEDTSLIFTVPLDIYITENNFYASVDGDLILSAKDNFVHRLIMLRGFGATFDKDGFFIVPDGSGALIPLNNPTSNEFYSQRAYGDDLTFSPVFKSANVAQSLSPFLAMKEGDRHFIARAVSNQPMANIVARPINRVNVVGSGNIDFTTIEKEFKDYSGLTRSGEGLILPENVTGGKYSVEYSFFGGEEVTYSDIAREYREILQKDGLLSTLKNEPLPLVVETVGAVQKKVSRLGIPVTTTLALTTYEQAAEIAEYFTAVDNGNVILRYTGWANGGLNHSIMKDISLIDKLGGKSGFEQLLSRASQKNMTFFPSVDLTLVGKDKAFDGFDYRSQGIKRLDLRAAAVTDYHLVTGAATTKNRKLLVSPEYLPKYADEFIGGAMTDYAFEGIDLVTLGKNLNSNFQDRKTMTQNISIDYYHDTFKKFEATGKPIMIEMGNDYSWAYADYILYFPVGSSENKIQTEAIPFFQMVLHGYISYASKPINSRGDVEIEVLKAVETGSMVYFRFMHAEDIVLKDTDHENLYSMSFEPWKEKAAACYKRVSEALNPVRGTIMTSHEKIGDMVYRTSYDNGFSTIVNYGHEPVKIGGLEIGAKDFAVINPS